MTPQHPDRTGRRHQRAALRRPGHLRPPARAPTRCRTPTSPWSASRSTPGVSYRPGARFGPGAHPGLVQAAAALPPAAGRRAVRRAAGGRRRATSRSTRSTSAEAIATIERASDELRADGTKLITLGGDHTIALPLLRSLHRDHGPIAVLHFDAHLDTWDTYFGAPFTHGTPFRRASEEGLLDPEHCLHVGIRGPLYSSRGPDRGRRARLPGDRLRRLPDSTGWPR